MLQSHSKGGAGLQTVYCPDRESLLRAAEQLESGDCVEVDSFGSVAAGSRELLGAVAALASRGVAFVSREEAVDTRQETGKIFLTLCQQLAALDRNEFRERQQAGIERARSEGKYRGRKPIAVDEELFESVVALWKSGGISARQAMTRLNLKPNTFYRRIKEMEELKMKDYKEVEKAIRSEIHEAAQQSRKELTDLKKQVRAEAKEVKSQVRAEAKEMKKAADEKLELHDVERERRIDRIRAEADHIGEVKQMKKDLEAETRELKKLLDNKE